MEIVAKVAPQPINFVLPTIGNILLSAKDADGMNKIKKRIEDLEAKQDSQKDIDEIRAKLESIYESLIKQGESNHKDFEEIREIYSVDVICASLRSSIEDDDIIKDLTNILNKFVEDSVSYPISNDEELVISNVNEDGLYDVIVDTLYVDKEEIVFNLMNPVPRPELNDFIGRVNEIVRRELYNDIKMLSFY